MIRPNAYRKRKGYDEMMHYVIKNNDNAVYPNRSAKTKLVEKFGKMHKRQLEHMQNQLDNRETMQKHTTTRNKWVERQNNANYRNEYNRIKYELDQSTLHGETVERLKSRTEYLKELFSDGNV